MPLSFSLANIGTRINLFIPRLLGDINNPYASAVLNSAPISYWRLKETSGAQVVNEINNNALPGSYFNLPILNQPTFNKDVGDKSVTFNGINQGIDFGNNVSQDLDIGSFECWVKATNTNTSFHDIFLKRGFYEVGLNNNILSTYSFGNNELLSTGINLGDNIWHHLVLCFSHNVTNGSQLYLDGNLVKVMTMTKNPNLDTRKITVGYQPNVNGNFQFLSGSVDEPAIYSRMLPQSEILAHYNAAF